MLRKSYEHSLRTITFEYDDAIPITEFEEQLLEKYLEIHTKAEAIKKMGAYVWYRFKELDDQIAYAEKAFAPIAEILSGFLKEAEALEKTNAEVRDIRDLETRMQNYHPEIVKFHDSVLSKMADSAKGLWEAFFEFQDADIEMGTYFDEYLAFCQPLYKEYDRWSLDLVSYDRDEQIFREVFSETSEMHRSSQKVMDRYDAMMQTVEASYGIWDKTRKLISKLHDTENLFDSSLSESYAAGTGDPKKKPLYLLEPGSKQIASFPQNYGLLASPAYKKFIFSVPRSAILSRDTTMIEELILTLQHYPKLIEKWIFAVEIQICNDDDIAMDPDDWKGYGPPMLWFHAMYNLPCSIFFMSDADTRGYVLMGDILANDQLQQSEDGEQVALTGETLEKVRQRMFHACWFFLLYCHNTGFDPKPYVEALLADFDLFIDYEQIKEEYEKDIAKGIELRARPKE